MRVALVAGTTSGGIGTHVRMLAVGLASRGIAASVVSPTSADALFGFSALRGVAFTAVEIGDRPSPRDVAAVLRLRQLVRHSGADASDDAAASPPRNAGADASDEPALSRPQRAAHHPEADSGVGAAAGGGRTVDVVHAHGLRAGAFTVLALAGVRGERRPALVVTVHNAPPVSRGVAAVVYPLLERLVARCADLVLCASPDLAARARAAGAHRVDRAVVPAPDRPEPAATAEADQPFRTERVPGSAPVAGGRPTVLAAGRLVAQKGFGALLEAAAGWQDLDPSPQVLIAGEGPLAGELRARAAALGVDVTFLGHRADVPGLLAAATVFVLPSLWEGQPLVLQEALRAGAAIVATRVGGVPALTGEDAALLVQPDDAAQLAAAVRAVLTDPSLANRLRTAARERGGKLPSEADAVTAALEAYASATAQRRK